MTNEPGNSRSDLGTFEDQFPAMFQRGQGKSNQDPNPDGLVANLGLMRSHGVSVARIGGPIASAEPRPRFNPSYYPGIIDSLGARDKMR